MPQFNRGQTVHYKPVGGMLFCPASSWGRLLTYDHWQAPESHTAESTGIVRDVLTEPGMQADRNVNASRENPRYEASTTYHY